MLLNTRLKYGQYCHLLEYHRRVCYLADFSDAIQHRTVRRSPAKSASERLQTTALGNLEHSELPDLAIRSSQFALTLTTRTFGHRIFKLDENLNRFYRSLHYLRIDPGISKEDLRRATEEVAEINLRNVSEGEDIWVTQRITHGLEPADRRLWTEYTERTVLVESRPLPFRDRGKFYRDDLRARIPSVSRPAPDTLSPRAKTHNNVNFWVISVINRLTVGE